MRKLILAAAVLWACGPSEQAATDSATMTAAAAPAALTATDVTGTWNGVTMAEGSDSVLARWTVVSTGIDSKGVLEGTTDTVTYTHTFDADSFMAVSAPFSSKQVAGNAQVVSRIVGRLMAGKMAGTETITLASKPDSVVMRARWEATKAP